jgi:hypothetical protein
MFSVPESIEMRAPAERANHSTRDPEFLGKIETGDDARALGLRDGPEGPQRVSGEQDPLDALGMELGRGGDDAADDAGTVLAGGPLGGHQGTGLVEVVLDEAAAVADEQRLQLVGVDQAPATGAQDLLGIRIQGCHPLGGGRLDAVDDARSRLVGEARDDRDASSPGRRDAAFDPHLLDSRPGRHRRDASPQRGQLLDIGVDQRPDVDPHLIGVEAGPRAAGPGARGPDRFQTVGQGPLHVGQPDDLAVVITHDDDLAHLSQGDQPAIGGIVPGDAVEEQHIPGGGDPGEVEVAKSPQVESTAHHRMDAAHGEILGEAAVGAGPEGEIADLGILAAHHADGDPAERGHEVEPTGHVDELRRCGVVVLGQVGGVEVEIDDRLAGAALDLLLQGSDQGAVGHEFVQPADRRDQAAVAAVEAVCRAGERAAEHGILPQVGEAVLAIVAPDQDGEHRLVRRDAAAKPVTEEADDALGDVGQDLHPGGAVGPVRIAIERLELRGDIAQDGRAVGLDDRLLEPAEAHAPREIADEREAQLGGRDEPVEHDASALHQVALRRRRGEPAAQDAHGERDLGLRALPGQEHPEDRALQLRSPVQTVDAVVREHAAQPVAELRGQAAAVGVERAHIGVEMLARGMNTRLGLLGILGGAVAAEFGEVGEEFQQRQLPFQRSEAAGNQGIARDEVVGQRLPLVAGVDVIAHQHPAEIADAAPGPGLDAVRFVG